jgi:hypothetical protein
VGCASASNDSPLVADWLKAAHFYYSQFIYKKEMCREGGVDLSEMAQQLSFNLHVMQRGRTIEVN